MVELNLSSLNAFRRHRRRGKRPVRIGLVFVLVGIGLIAAIYFGLLVKLFRSQASETSAVNGFPLHNRTKEFVNQGGTSKRARYSDWKDLALELAALPADEILRILKSQDPFGVRTFEEKLLQTESDRQAILQLKDIQNLFPCPIDERITLPDQRDHERARKFRQGLSQLKQDKDNFVFLFFQHLRKAGGTNFCTLAEHNLQKPQVPQ